MGRGEDLSRLQLYFKSNRTQKKAEHHDDKKGKIFLTWSGQAKVPPMLCIPDDKTTASVTQMTTKNKTKEKGPLSRSYLPKVPRIL